MHWFTVTALQLAPDDHLTFRVDAMNLKNRLRDIETNRRDSLHGPSSSESGHPLGGQCPWHLRAGGGAVHSITTGLFRASKVVQGVRSLARNGLHAFYLLDLLAQPLEHDEEQRDQENPHERNGDHAAEHRGAYAAAAEHAGAGGDHQRHEPGDEGEARHHHGTEALAR